MASYLSQMLGGAANPLQSLLQQQALQNPFGGTGGPYDDLVVRPGDDTSIVPIPNATVGDDTGLQALAGPGASGSLDALAAALGGGAPARSPATSDPFNADPFSGDAGGSTGGAGTSGSPMFGGGYTPPPTPPRLLDEDTLYPSPKRAILQGVVPGIAALITGLAGGGKVGAAALLQGANAGNEGYNADLKERGLFKYKQAQDAYARDHQLWQDQQQRLEHNTSIIAALAEKAKSFANPADGLAWLKAQAPLYAKQGIDVMDAWQGAQVGADTRRQEYLAGKLEKVIDVMRQRAKDAGRLFDESKLDDSMAIRIDGETRSLRSWRELTNALPPSASAGATTSAIEQKVNSEVQDHIAMIKARTGQEPTPDVVLQLTKDEWNKVATDESQSEEMKKLALEHARKANALLDAQAANLRASAKQHGTAVLTPQQELAGRAIATKLAQNKVYQQAQQMGALYDQFLGTMNDPHPNGVSDQTLIAEFIRAKHPGSSRVGDEESLRIELARAGVSNPRAMANRVWNGQALLPEQREQMADVLRRSYESGKAGAEMLVDGYGQMLKARGIPEGMFIMPEGGSKTNPIRGYWVRDAEKQIADEQAAQEQATKFRGGGGVAPGVTQTPAQIRGSGGRRLIPGAAEAQAATPTQKAAGAAQGVVDTEGAGLVYTDPGDGKRYKILGKNAAGQIVRQEQ
jgi:hypothetical protein